MISYLYFYSDNEPPPLLSIAVESCLKNSGRLLLATTSLIYTGMPTHVRNHELLTYVNIERDHIYSNPLIDKYIKLINAETIQSNHPPTEVQCIFRWILLDELMSSNYVNRIFSYDWDTILLPGCQEVIGQHSAGLVMHLSNCDYTHPIFILCPHAAIVDKESVSSYVKYLEHYLNLAASRSFLPLYFSDIPPWSSVISRRILSGQSVSDWNTVSMPKGFYCCSNFRDDGGPLHPERSEYLVDDRRFNYLPNGQDNLSVHNYFLEGREVKVRGYCDGDIYTQTWTAPWIHFSGTEGKYIFFKYFLEPMRAKGII
jgi:hypothetical protein